MMLEKLFSVINAYFPEPHASLLNGILFGKDIKQINYLYEDLKIVGLLHLVVLSGVNITILGAIVAKLTQHLHKTVSFCITILTIVLFVSMVGPKPPIVRAALMGIIALIGIQVGRKAYGLYTLFLSAFIIFVFKPSWVFGVSFQLSFAATFGILLFHDFYPFKKDEQKRVFLPKFIWEELAITISAYLFTTPIIFIYFGQISLLAPLSNILVSPLVPAIMILGFVTVILGLIHMSFGVLPALATFGLLEYMRLVITLLSSVPFGYIKN